MHSWLGAGLGLLGKRLLASLAWFMNPLHAVAGTPELSTPACNGCLNPAGGRQRYYRRVHSQLYGAYPLRVEQTSAHTVPNRLHAASANSAPAAGCPACQCAPLWGKMRKLQASQLARCVYQLASLALSPFTPQCCGLPQMHGALARVCRCVLCTHTPAGWPAWR